MKYRDKHGNLKPVKFASYIWKRIDGFILDSLKKEIKREQKERRNLRIDDAEIQYAISEILDGVEDID